MTLSIEMIKDLRRETGAGVQDCRLALEESGLNYQTALSVLKKNMASQASKLEERQATRGWIETYSHGDGRLAVVVEINTETDFSARAAEVRSLGHEVALQIAAARPLHVCVEDIPPDTLADLKNMTIAEAREAGKSEKVIDLMVEGRLKKFFARNVLLEQP